jgi:hypothetical protein
MIVDVLDDGVESAVRIDNVELVIQPPVARADFDGDGDVDGADFLRWQRGLGTYVAAKHEGGDADFDGDVLGDDLTIWRSGYGEAAVPSQAWLNDLSGVAVDASLGDARSAPTAIRRRHLVAEALLPLHTWPTAFTTVNCAETRRGTGNAGRLTDAAERDAAFSRLEGLTLTAAGSPLKSLLP